MQGQDTVVVVWGGWDVWGGWGGVVMM